MPPSPWEGEGFVRSDVTDPIPSAFPSSGAARHLPYPFCPFGTFPLDKGNRPQGKASLSVTASPCQLPQRGSQGCTFGTLPLASPCGGGAQQGRRGPPSKHKKALPPWGFQGGRGRRGRGCSLGWRGQPRLNSGDLWPVFQSRRVPGIFFCVRSGGADHFSSPTACSTASTILPERIMAATLFMSR